jgi:hypothetical protein
MCRFIQITTNFIGFKPGFWFGFGSVINLYGISNRIKPKVRSFEDDYRAIQRDFDVVFGDFSSVFKQSLRDVKKENIRPKN